MSPKNVIPKVDRRFISTFFRDLQKNMTTNNLASRCDSGNAGFGEYHEKELEPEPVDPETFPVHVVNEQQEKLSKI